MGEMAPEAVPLVVSRISGFEGASGVLEKAVGPRSPQTVATFLSVM